MSRDERDRADGERSSAPAEDDALRCPFCDATMVSTVSPFGSQLLMSQFRCDACHSYFEGVRPDRYESGAAEPAAPPSPGQS